MSESLAVTGFKTGLTPEALAEYEAASLDAASSAAESALQREVRQKEFSDMRATGVARILAKRAASNTAPSPRTSALSNTSAARGKGKFRRKPMQQLFSPTARDFNLRVRKPGRVQHVVETDVSDTSSISLYCPQRK